MIRIRTFAMFVITLGLIALVDSLNLMNDAWNKLWPVLFIVVGFSKVWNAFVLDKKDDLEDDELDEFEDEGNDDLEDDFDEEDDDTQEDKIVEVEEVKKTHKKSVKKK